jgi:K+-sensing histidine kinase KdpD
MKKKYGDDDPMTFRILNALKTSCDDIVNLSSNLLDISKMEEGRMEINKENYSYKQIQAIVMKFAKNIIYEEKGIKVEIKPPGNSFTISVDPYLLERVMQNLFNNATKYTYRSGRIEMGFETGKTENIIYLFNSGNPIPDEQKDILFNKYIILGQKRSQYSKGLGLFFCRMVMEAHGGRIWVESHDDGNYFKCSFIN